MKVNLIIGSTVNWQKFIALTQSVLGRSPVRILDAKRISYGDLFSFVAALKELEEPGSEPYYALAEGFPFLNHLSCSFMVEVSDREAETLRNLAGLTVTYFEGNNSNHILLMTGTLLNWRESVIYYCSRKQNFTYRALFNLIYNEFKKVNLKELFHGYTQVTVDPNTFILETL